MKTLGTEVAEQIDWSAPRLVCIAGDFTRYDEHAVQQISRNIELFRYRQLRRLPPPRARQLDAPRCGRSDGGSAKPKGKTQPYKDGHRVPRAGVTGLARSTTTLDALSCRSGTT